MVELLKLSYDRSSRQHVAVTSWQSSIRHCVENLRALWSKATLKHLANNVRLWYFVVIILPITSVSESAVCKCSEVSNDKLQQTVPLSVINCQFELLRAVPKQPAAWEKLGRGKCCKSIFQLTACTLFIWFDLLPTVLCLCWAVGPMSLSAFPDDNFWTKWRFEIDISHAGSPWPYTSQVRR